MACRSRFRVIACALAAAILCVLVILPKKPVSVRERAMAASERAADPTCAVGGYLCSELRQTGACRNGSDVFNGPAAIYVTHADPPFHVERAFALVPGAARRPFVYASVIGSMAGLNGLASVTPQVSVLFFDVNPWMVEYGRMIAELIKTTPSREGFMSAMYGRQMGPYLKDEYNSRNPLDDLHDEKLVERTQAGLPQEVRCAYAWLQRDHMVKADSSQPRRHRNCEKLLIFRNPKLSPYLNPHRRGPYDPAAASYKTNECAFYYGHGWLKNDESYMAVRRALMAAKLHFVVGSFETAFLDNPDFHDKSAVMYLSNIPYFLKGKLLQSKMGVLSGSIAKVTVVSIKPNRKRRKPRGIHHEREVLVKSFFNQCPNRDGSKNAPRHGKTHEYAWLAIEAVLRDQMAGGLRSDKVLEVARRVPWGFYEIGSARTNVAVKDYLAGTFDQPTVILHILVGEGEPRPVFAKALAKALATAERVLVMEHHNASVDWKGATHVKTDVKHMFSYEEVEEMFHQLAPRAEVHGCFVAGAQDTTRNMLFWARPLPA